MQQCNYCQKEILNRRADAKYCSEKCYRTAEKRRQVEKKTGEVPHIRGPNTGRSSDPEHRKNYPSEKPVEKYEGKYAKARELGYRSMYEMQIMAHIEENGLTVEYEPFKIPYLMKGNYVPDMVLPNGIIVEAKGYFDNRARAKMVAVKKHNPELDIRFVFMNSRTKLRKGGSQATYADWCKRYGFPFADGMIPLKWFAEVKDF